MNSLLVTFKNDVSIIEAGVDESGRGTLFGPVFAAAVILDLSKPLPARLNDSKKLSRRMRAELRSWIETNALCWAVGKTEASVIDHVNIWNATQLAMTDALNGLSTRPNFILVDGNRFDGYDGIDFVTIEKGDAKFASIAAASILAKEHHDEYIAERLKDDPTLERYGLQSNMGYGTGKHIEALQEFGPSMYHRLTFGRVKEYAPNAPSSLAFTLSSEDDGPER